MQTETKKCRGCSNQFAINPADAKFYERVNATAPEYCPACRMQRRIAHRNERTLYKRTCDSCKKEIVAIYPAKTPWPVYCGTCWWGDGWDAKSFGREYDLKRPFFDQLKELQSKVPRIGLLSLNSVNSEYTNNSSDNKNCYLLFAAEKNEDSMYGRLIQNSKSIVDAAWVYDSELCYECIDCRQCYQCLFSERCQTSTDLLFCFDVRHSKNCILSTNLRHAQYYIENKPYSKEEYEKKKKEILASQDTITEAKKRFEELKGAALVKYAFQTKCVDATGDYLFNCHEVRGMFDASNAKACAYMADAEDPIDCVDGNNMYYKPELCLDIMSTLQAYNSKHSTFIFYCTNVEYSDNSHNCQDCFGCIGLKKSNYCILNKQYSPEDYQKVKQQIVESMKKEGTYGSFIPPAMAPFGYNEALVRDYFPLSKEEAIKKGFWWQEATTGTTGKETIKRGAIPKTIEEVKDSMVNEVLACEACGLNFRITPAELAFYRRMHLPLPTKDFECRHQERLKKRTPRKLWHRQCMCDYVAYKNSNKHANHSTGQCPNEFETSYAPERKETVYCEQCYQAEVV